MTAPDGGVGNPPDTTAPDAPTNLVIDQAGKRLSGRGEAGTTVQVRDADGNVLATGTVGADGTFHLTLQPALVDGSTVQVLLTDAAGNVSAPGAVTSADLLPPAQPSGLIISADGSVLTGRAEPGSTVKVLAADGTTVLGSAVAGANGAFSISLVPPQVDGEQLHVTATDHAGNTSTAGSVTAPDIDTGGGDTTAPAPASNLVISADGRTLTGSAEAGARVEVRDANGTLIGSTIAGPDGTFSLSLDPIQANGETLAIRVIDAAGNSSAAVDFTAPDSTPPQAVGSPASMPAARPLPAPASRAPPSPCAALMAAYWAARWWRATAPRNHPRYGTDQRPGTDRRTTRPDRQRFGSGRPVCTGQPGT